MTASTGDTATTTSTDGPDPNNSSPAPTAGPTNTQPPASFAQADVDRIVADRVARERGKYADYDEVKKRAGEWDRFVAESATDQEKALTAARKDTEESTWAKARSEFGGRMVEAHLTAAAAGRLNEGALSALIAGINKTVFLTDTGEVDAAKITQFIDGIAPPAASNSRPGGFGQGPRTGAPVAGLDAGAAAWEARHAKGVTPPMFT